MRVFGVFIMEDQLRAGRAAMVGRFTCKDVESALAAAGCPGMVSRVADRLLQQERKAGRIVAMRSPYWDRVSP